MGTVRETSNWKRVMVETRRRTNTSARALKPFGDKDSNQPVPCGPQNLQDDVSTISCEILSQSESQQDPVPPHGPEPPTEEGSHEPVDGPSSSCFDLLTKPFVQCAQRCGCNINTDECSHIKVLLVCMLICVVTWGIGTMVCCLVDFVGNLYHAIVLLVKYAAVMALVLGMLHMAYDFSVRKHVPHQKSIGLMMTLAVVCANAFMGHDMSWLLPGASFGSGFLSGVLYKHIPTDEPSAGPIGAPTGTPTDEPMDALTGTPTGTPAETTNVLTDASSACSKGCAEPSAVSNLQDVVARTVIEQGRRFFVLTFGKMALALKELKDGPKAPKALK